MQKQILAFLFFISVMIFSACGSVMPVALTTATVTAAPSLTPFPQVAATSTITLTPHPTVVATLPSIPIPTLLSATPLPAPENYHLVEWTPEKAEALIRLLENYPETLSDMERGYHEHNYFDSFYYAAQAGYEGLLRFPDDLRGKNWRWWLSSDLMQSSQLANKGKPSRYFAGLVSTSLNAKEITVEELPGWVSANLPGVSATLINLEPPKGYSSSYVLQISSNILWLLKTQAGFQVYPLVDDFYYYFYSLETRDLTGDGVPEVFVYLSQDANFVGGVGVIYVFDLSHVPYRQLTFGSKHEQKLAWVGFGGKTIETRDHQALIQIQNSYLVGCPIYRMETYQWNGLRFDLAGVQFEFDRDKASDLRYCDQMSPGSSYLAARPSEIIPLFETLQPYWPAPEYYYFMTREPYPKDELRFRLGVLYALDGNQDKATEYLTDLINHPTNTRSAWVASAKLFFAKYTTSAQLYRACVTTTLCDVDFVIEQIIKKMDIADFPSVINQLRGLGVPIRASALLDFNQDNSPEYWFTVLHPNRTDIEFWVVFQNSGSLTARYLDNVTSYTPSIKLVTNAKPDTLFQIGDSKLFGFDFSPNGEPVISEYQVPEKVYPDALVRQTFDGLRESLYAGRDPVKIKMGLLALQKNRDFKCRLDYEHFRYIEWQFPNYCPDFFYTLGLSYELSGGSESAIHLYWQVWHDYPKSPYALMARFKLEPNP